MVQDDAQVDEAMGRLTDSICKKKSYYVFTDTSEVCLTYPALPYLTLPYLTVSRRYARDVTGCKM